MIVNQISGVVVTLTPSEKKLLDAVREPGETQQQAFERIIKTAFKQKRKTAKSL